MNRRKFLGRMAAGVFASHLLLDALSRPHRDVKRLEYAMGEVWTVDGFPGPGELTELQRQFNRLFTEMAEHMRRHTDRMMFG